MVDVLVQSWMTDVELFAAVVAALIHDFEHTGTTNTFHVNTGYVGFYVHGFLFSTAAFPASTINIVSDSHAALYLTAHTSRHYL